MSDKPRGQSSEAGGVEDAWELYTLGELSKEDEAVLRALTEEPEAQERMAVHAPLDESFRARVAEGLSAQIEQQRRARRTRTLRTAAFGSALAMAAAALLVLLPRNADGLPAYRLEAAGGVANARGAATVVGPTVFTPDSELSITLTPDTRVEGELVVQASLAKDGRVVPWTVPIERAASGAVRVHGRAAALLPLGFGDYRARFELKRRSSERTLRTLELSFAYRPAP